MTWTIFFAADDDFTPLLDGMLSVEGSQLFEVYGFLSKTARSFTSSSEAIRTLGLGLDQGGSGHAINCALWVPSVMPTPSRRRVNMESGQWRETVEGCGLFWLQAGGRHEGTITESSLGWFTQGAARQRCTVEPGPESINWQGHAEVAKRLAQLLGTLATARAGRFQVLPRAAAHHATGARLIYGMGIKQEVRIGAA
jgi:hypothetical protein